MVLVSILKSLFLDFFSLIERDGFNLLLQNPCHVIYGERNELLEKGIIMPSKMHIYGERNKLLEKGIIMPSKMHINAKRPYYTIMDTKH